MVIWRPAQYARIGSVLFRFIPRLPIAASNEEFVADICPTESLCQRMSARTKILIIWSIYGIFIEFKRKMKLFYDCLQPPENQPKTNEVKSDCHCIGHNLFHRGVEL